MNEVCPKCGSDEWTHIEWNQWMGVSPFDDYRECVCGHEWNEEDVKEQA